MADTMTCYSEKDTCDDCGESPVQFIHWGPLTNNEYKKLCKKCFIKRSEGTK